MLGEGARVLAPDLHLASQRLLSCRVAPPECPLLLSHRVAGQAGLDLQHPPPPQGEKARSGVGPPVHGEG